MKMSFSYIDLAKIPHCEFFYQNTATDESIGCSVNMTLMVPVKLYLSDIQHTFYQICINSSVVNLCTYRAFLLSALVE